MKHIFLTAVTLYSKLYSNFYTLIFLLQEEEESQIPQSRRTHIPKTHACDLYRFTRTSVLPPLQPRGRLLTQALLQLQISHKNNITTLAQAP